jgi:non-specific serine/threonine protein kinase/serine/threonine-protein kinase
VCLAEPARPSTVAPPELRRALRGDLDNVLLMALRKEPERRYASVDQLSDDLGRHLGRVPVRARADTFRYRSGRWIRRNPVAAASVVLLLGWVATASYQARVAGAERARAQRRFEDVRRLANTFLFDFHDAIVDVPGTTRARELVLGSAVQYLAGLAAEAQGDPGLQRELGLAYQRLGVAVGGVGVANLGDQRGAVAHLEKAVALLAQAHAARPEPALAGELADAHRRLARSLSGQVRFAEAGRHVQEARALAAQAARARGRVEDVLRQASIEQLQADWHSDQSAWQLAAESLRAGLALLRALPEDARGRSDVRRQRLTLSIRLGDALGQLGRPDQSVAALDELIADLAAPGTPVVAEQRMLALVHGMAGSALIDLQRPSEALHRLQDARRVLDEMRRADPDNYQASKDLTMVLAYSCTAASESGRRALAKDDCRAALALAEQLHRAHRDLPGVIDALGVVWYHNGKLARAEKRPADAVAFFRRMTTVVPADGDGVAQRQLAWAHAALADALLDMGRRDEAEAAARRAVSLLDQARAATPSEPSVLRDQATAQARLARILRASPGAEAERGALRSAALATLAALERGGMTVPEVGLELGRLRQEVASASVSPPARLRRETP